MREAKRMAEIAERLTRFVCSGPVIPASNRRCAPAKLMYPPTVPPTNVIIAFRSIFFGIKLRYPASSSGGSETKTT